MNDELRKKTQDEKALKKSYEKRKQNLLKKGYELATLCGIDMCIIIFDNKNVKPQTWPADPCKVKQIITKYKKKQRMDLWNDRLKNLSEDKLKLLVEQLDSKIKAAKKKIKKVKHGVHVGDKSQQRNNFKGCSSGHCSDIQRANYLQNYPYIMLPYNHYYWVSPANGIQFPPHPNGAWNWDYVMNPWLMSYFPPPPTQPPLLPQYPARSVLPPHLSTSQSNAAKDTPKFQLLDKNPENHT